jgi:FtsZ-interacting cell division protein ZipA
MSGLPGFLRRSLRAEYSEDDDDLDNDSASSSSASSLPEATKNVDEANNSSAENVDERASTEKNSTASFQKVTEDENDPASFTAPSKPPLQSAQLPSNSRRSSEPLSTHASHTKTENASEGGSFHESFQVSDQQQQQQRRTPQTNRKKTFRESQFEKIFAANVVSMNDLRTLAWNGIPVGFISIFVLNIHCKMSRSC